MSFRTDLLPAVEAARAYAASFDVRTNRLTIRTRVWSGRYIQEGTPTDTDLVLPPHYPIRQISGAEVDSSGGKYRLTDISVNHITPSNGAGVGYTPEQLAPTIMNDHTEVLYLISGPLEGEYELVEAQFHRAFTYTLVLRRRLTTP